MQAEAPQVMAVPATYIEVFIDGQKMIYPVNVAMQLHKALTTALGDLLEEPIEDSEEPGTD